MTPPIIGLWSPAPGCGKSTVAQFLGDRQPGYMRVGFADPLRRMVVELLNSAGYPWHQAHRFVHWEKETPLDLLPGKPTARRLIRTLAEEYCHDLIHPCLLSELWGTRVRGMDCLVVADDVRKPDQALKIQSMGGQIWSVIRPGYKDSSGHRSEAGLGGVPVAKVIVNDGTLAELAARVTEAVR
jgi:hypothetical protein